MRLVPYLQTFEHTPRLWPQTPRFFADLFKDFPVNDSTAQNGECWVPAVDVLEKNGNLVLRAELPGMNEKEIELKIEGQILTLKGERKVDAEEVKSSYRSMECHHGAFSRSFSLPETVESDNIKADYKNGILTVTIPQKPLMQPREITVSVQ